MTSDQRNLLTKTQQGVCNIFCRHIPLSQGASGVDHCGLCTDLQQVMFAAPPPSEPAGDKKKDKDACVRELGYAWIYMHYLHPEWLSYGDSSREQKKRVETLMMECAVNWHTQVPQWWEYFHGRIIEEIENMC